MITIKRWFFVHGVLPFLIGLAIIFIAGCGYGIYLANSILKAQDSSVEELVKIVSIAYKQKNQEVFDLAFTSFVQSTKVSSIKFCENDKVLYSWPGNEIECASVASKISIVEKRLPSSANAKIFVKFNLLSKGYNFFLYIFSMAILIALVIFVGQRLRMRIERDLISLDLSSGKREIQTTIYEIHSLLSKAKEYERQAVEMNRLTELGSIYTQVSHDIRSPLSALNMVIATLSDVSGERIEIVKNASKRINEIASKLLAEGKKIKLKIDEEGASSAPGDTILKKVNFSELVREIVAEKRAQYSHLHGVSILIESDGRGDCFIKTEPIEMKSVISNLLNNSIESLEEGLGEIVIKMETNSVGAVLVEIRDTGCGIPEEILSKIGFKGFSFGKKSGVSGYGLGVSHARKIITESGGAITIKSRTRSSEVVESGTSVLLEF